MAGDPGRKKRLGKIHWCSEGHQGAPKKDKPHRRPEGASLGKVWNLHGKKIGQKAEVEGEEKKFEVQQGRGSLALSRNSALGGELVGDWHLRRGKSGAAMKEEGGKTLETFEPKNRVGLGTALKTVEKEYKKRGGQICHLPGSGDYKENRKKRRSPGGKNPRLKKGRVGEENGQETGSIEGNLRGVMQYLLEGKRVREGGQMIERSERELEIKGRRQKTALAVEDGQIGPSRLKRGGRRTSEKV